MSHQPVIRNAIPADAENLAALAIQVWLHTYATNGISLTGSRYVLSEFTPEKFAALIGNENNIVLLSEVNAHLVGYAVIAFGAACPASHSSTTQLATLYVQEHFTRAGVGSALIAEAGAISAQRAHEPMWLAVNARNSRAIGFYAKHGYRNIGVTYFELGGKKHENFVLVGVAG
jgi:diamine N-acetyltransferase